MTTGSRNRFDSDGAHVLALLWDSLRLVIAGSVRANVNVMCVFSLITVPSPIYVGAETFWVITMGVLIGISFIGAVWGEDKWIDEWLNEPGYNDPDEFQEYKNPPPRKEMEEYDPEAEALEEDLTWWERWEEFWYSQWWWPRDEESATEEVDLDPPSVPLPKREKDTRTWLVKWLDNATADLCKKPPEPATKEEDMFDDLWDWTVNLYRKITSPAPQAPGTQPTLPPTEAMNEEDEFEPYTWMEEIENFVKDRWLWRVLFDDDDEEEEDLAYSAETDDDEEDEKPGFKGGYFSVADDDDDDDGEGGGIESDSKALLVPYWLFMFAVLVLI